ncbi:peptidase S9, prolyl oligopeptidase active site domain protein [Bifidobacterium asteroides PRL2011]|uniref:S9 family peptidase n=1 Tax=Bifidobacterium asteroides TaxID=1684 RepID=UPI00028B27DA|nr:prolyl oligopeptidase family serine peptidase [Bifidobacterium asteroides]AFU70684.1 peptidase S9, prolyl oligopeptidase active site domain protein [Bifidobacterium asteroides PRL2011]
MAEEVDRAMEAYPRAKARTLRFTLGAPRSALAVGDGSRAVFLRSDGPEDLVTGLWLSVFDQEGRHHEVLLADPRALLEDADQEQVPAAELARRERTREGGEGIVDYSVDAAGDRVVFALGGRLWLSLIAPDGLTASTRALSLEDSDSAVLNPAISPDGTMVAYTTGGRLMVVTIGQDGGQDRERAVLALRPGTDDRMRLGLAEFVAGEEMDRYQGFWWSPDSRALLVEHTDSSDEPIWYISDPANPQVGPRARRYPQALTANARVGLSLVLLGQDAVDPWVGEVDWDHQAFEYLAVVRWQDGHRPLLLVQNRRQTEDRILDVQVPDVRQGLESGQNMTLLDPEVAPKVATRVLQTHDNDQWIDLVPGLPAYQPQGGLVDAFIDTEADTTRLRLDGRVFSPAGCQIRQVLSVGDRDVLAVVSTDPRSFDLMRLSYDGSIHVLNRLPGVWTASRAGHGIVVSGRTMASAQGQVRHCYLGADGDLDRLGAEGLGLVGEARPDSSARQTGEPVRPEHQDRPDRRAVDAGHINSQGAMSAILADTSSDPGFTPNVDFVRIGQHELFAAIVRPSESSPYASADSLPVLLKPYGGPGAQQVVFNQSYYWESQWWADQGFLVLTADGRGTPGRGPAWDRAIFEDMAQVTLDDQLEALEALPDFAPEADLGHVAMIGWSYGGFLSALSVLRAPDRIHAACAGAPPTDWTLYDTHYTERYLGLDPAVYRRNGIIDDAPSLRRPLMLIHGFADDNVSVANTLRLSGALMAAGRPHTVLPLTGITHMTNDETVAENLLILQRDFLREALKNKTD